jgi:hypothetical protein
MGGCRRFASLIRLTTPKNQTKWVLKMTTTTTEGARTSGVILKTVVVYSNGAFPLDIAIFATIGATSGFFKAARR